MSVDAAVDAAIEDLTDTLASIYGDPRTAATNQIADALALARDLPAGWVATLVASADRAASDTAYIGRALPHPDNATWLSLVTAAHAAAMPATWPTAMASRGSQWVHGCVQSWVDGLTDVELARLDALALAGTRRRAHLSCGRRDTSALVALFSLVDQDRAFAAYVAAHGSEQVMLALLDDGASVADLHLCQRLGIDPRLALAALPANPPVRGADAITAIVEFATAARCDATLAYRALCAGVPPATVKAYRPLFVNIEDIAALAAADVSPRAARSLRAADKSLCAETLTALVHAGVTSGKTLRRWRATLTSDTPEATVENLDLRVASLAGAGLPIDVAEELRPGVPVEHLVTLFEAGITSWRPWREAVEPRSQGTLGRDVVDSRGYEALAAFARSGGTPTQMRLAQRAGISVVDLPGHERSTREALWAAGAANREAVLANEQRLLREWGPGFAADMGPWPCEGPADL